MHTPGPWTIGPANIVKAVTEIPGIGRQTQWIADVIDCRPMVVGEREANARLIAAAPKLLAALKAYLDQTADVAVSPVWPELRELRENMRKAVNEAEGRTE